MQVVNLYKYLREDGGTTTSPTKPEGIEYSIICRLIADEGKAVTNDGTNWYTCIDVQDSAGWYEINEPDESEDPSNYDAQEIVDILTGVKE